ncbi:MAG: pyruvate, phosphate dikinase, partial [Pseudomonadota bacterium]|nr:pyruvate, phosphate dikinase [Pseudomonadota bacterium]
LPVPFGLVITTPTCREYFERGNKLPRGLEPEYRAAMKLVEGRMGARFGDPENPLLVSVRSGAPVSMPGMMNTILNLGLNDAITAGLAERTGNPRFAYDSQRRFIQMFADVVLGVDGERYEDVIEAHKKAKGYETDPEMSAEDWQAVIAEFKAIAPIPEDPFEQLRLAIEAVFTSWHSPRAQVYREMNEIPESLGTAVTVQPMVFGNFGDTSGSGVAFTRNPATGVAERYGEFLFNAAGEDVVAGIRTPEPISALEARLPEVYQQLMDTQQLLEKHYRDMQDIEFTVQEGRFFLLQTRSGKRTGRAAIKVAVDMVREGLLGEQDALMRVSPEHVESFLHPMVDPAAKTDIVATGLAASPGGATGKVVFTADDAVVEAEKGEAIILVRRETTPEDIHGMRVVQGILTELGGMTSHAAVVARGMGVCAITGCSAIEMDRENRVVRLPGGIEIREGDLITLDGNTGDVMLGDVPKVEAAGSDDFQTLLTWADRHRRLKVRANAETLEDATKARELGAEGIGLCRTEHMFFQSDRIDVMRRMILAVDAEERARVLEELEAFQFDDMLGLFKVMDGLPVTIRLLDPPLHEFLPHGSEELHELAARIDRPVDELRTRLADLAEVNPMLGFRGCRLSVVFPEITEMQVRAIMSAAVKATEQGLRPMPEIMIPLVVNVREIRLVTEIIDRGIGKALGGKAVSIPYKIGTMMETPRSCLGAGRIARAVEFMSFGTNDLTQMTYGFSRDDAGRFIPQYLDAKLIEADPFVSLDRRGVGRLLHMAVEEARGSGVGLKFGICGEHGGDPRSIRFCHDIGLDYVSCSAFRVPVARIAAAQAAVRASRRVIGERDDGKRSTPLSVERALELRREHEGD